MSHAIKVYETGGPEVMRWRSVKVGEPAFGEARIRHHAVGLNYIDVYFRTGLYAAPALPFTPGLEAAGVVEAVGPGVSTVTVGDRVAYASAPLGAYSEVRLMPAARLVTLPQAIEMTSAAAMMLQGMTVEYLLQRAYPVQAGQTILFHAAAGGVGMLACQWAKHLGATVIGTVGNDAKAALACAHGCDHAIIYSREDVVARVREITDGKGVAVVYDSVGQDTFAASLGCLAPRGMLVSFGQSSGKVADFDISVLSTKGSLYLTRPNLMSYTATRAELLASAQHLFDRVLSGVLKINLNQTFPLAEAQAAHRALEGRETTGATVLTI